MDPENDFVEKVILPMGQVKALLEVYPELIKHIGIEKWRLAANFFSEISDIINKKIVEIEDADDEQKP